MRWVSSIWFQRSVCELQRNLNFLSAHRGKALIHCGTSNTSLHAEYLCYVMFSFLFSERDWKENWLKSRHTDENCFMYPRATSLTYNVHICQYSGKSSYSNIAVRSDILFQKTYIWAAETLWRFRMISPDVWKENGHFLDQLHQNNDCNVS